MFGTRKNLAALQRELQQGQKLGRNQNKGQQRRIKELKVKASSNPASLSGEEMRFLEAVDAMALQDARDRAAFNDASELRSYQMQAARGEAPSNPERFNVLMQGEAARRNAAQRQVMMRNATIGAGVAGAGAVGLGAAGVLSGNAPFSLGLVGGDDSALVEQQYRIAQELEEREFQNELAQRTAVAQTDLANKLQAMQQRAIFEQNLANSLNAQQAGIGGGGGGVDILSKIDGLAGQYMQQGIEPPKAFDLAQNAIRMDGSANAYL